MNAGSATGAKLGTYYRTLRPTWWSQLLWRARYGLERRRELGPRRAARWRWPEARAPRSREDFPDLPLIHATETIPEVVAELERGEHRFLNQTRHLGRERPDWRLGTIGTDRLGTITLHYHRWAWDLAHEAAKGAKADEAAALFRHYLSAWMSRCALDAPVRARPGLERLRDRYPADVVDSILPLARRGSLAELGRVPRRISWRTSGSRRHICAIISNGTCVPTT